MQLFSGVKTFVTAHKIFSTIILLAIAYGGYSAYKKLTTTTGETHYVLGVASKGTIISSITGTGQVSASNQVDLKPKVSGTITSLLVSDGQSVKEGQALMRLDSRDAQKSVRDAEATLESAKLSLEKIMKPADSLSITQSENTLARARESKQNTEADLVKVYGDGFNTVANVFLDIPAIIAGLQDTLFTINTNLSISEQPLDFYTSVAARYDDRATIYSKDASDKYQAARAQYNKVFAHYKTLSVTSNTSDIEGIINETSVATKLLADAVKSANDLVQFYKDKLGEHNITPKPFADTQLTTLSGYTTKMNADLSNLLSATSAIKNDRDTIVNNTRTIDENTQSLAKLKAGSDTLDIASAQLSVKQRENALLDAQEKLADYTVRAPFDGTIAKLNVKETTDTSAGTAVATLITKQQLATISLNEVDAAKVHVGQKSTITFDAIEGLALTGKVSQIDTVGTVTQGVVTYQVQIAFDTQDERVRGGMSVSATIITSIKQDILTVQSSAVKANNSSSFVLVFDQKFSDTGGKQGVISPTPPREQSIEVGVANDSDVEIISGLKEGDQIVTKTITPTTTTTAAPSLIPSGGRGFGGGGGRGG